MPEELAYCHEHLSLCMNLSGKMPGSFGASRNGQKDTASIPCAWLLDVLAAKPEVPPVQKIRGL
ncbi:MAG: hypothetical protein LBB83_09140 [Treponema sp.]|jgi:hypothetical protein|nr:hypothetical protein [Treponema sp.]